MDKSSSVLDISGLLKSSDISEHYELGIDTSSAGDAMTDVKAVIDLKNTAGVVTVKAVIQGVCSAVCDRCLDEVKLPLTAKLDTIIYLNESKDDSVSVTDGVIDLAKTAFDALSLELPMRIVCREDCKGLCQRCGVNLNRESCNCTIE